MPINSPISGNVETGNEFAQITGWPNSEWENYIVTVSHIKPMNITSVRAGEILGLGALEGNPTLPNYFEVAITYKGIPKNAEEYLVPCALGCVQLYDLGNGICDTQCNVSECNFDQWDCLDQAAIHRKITLPQHMYLDIFTDKSWYILHKLHKITGEQNIAITRGPLSIFALSEKIVTDMLVSSVLSPGLLYNTSHYSAVVIKHFNVLRYKNATKGQMIAAVATKIISEMGSPQLSPYTAPITDIQTIDLSIKSLKYPDVFERALQFLQEYRQLIYVKVDANLHTEAYFHIEVSQQEEVGLCQRHRYKNQKKNNCHAVHSCFGHGVCNIKGSCSCDADYEGFDCKTSKCLNNCSVASS
jgi:hypothetical protein